ncbi:MAG: response regulator, partial [Blastocatellia bacterium]
FQVLLPVSAHDGQAPKEIPALVAQPGGGETVLLVEDDPSVHQFLRTVLTDYGYQVLDAYSGAEALQVWEQHLGSIRLLLTDMVLPAGINGRDLATQLRTHDPDLKVIFTSGYNPEMVNQRISLQRGQIFLQKPCLPFQLLETVRNCLDC